jgi:hypothetical protein
MPPCAPFAARFAFSALAALALVPLTASAAEFCSDTAELQELACINEARDDYYNARAICLNLGDGGERAACNAEASAALREANGLCDEQDDAREDLCEQIGEARYEPDFDPANYQDPRRPGRPNPYFPLRVGNRKTFSDGAETVEIVVRDELKSIEGVACIVVNDVVREDGELIEDTDDWFALHDDGTVVYCGEEVKDFETFEDDDPPLPELVSIDGSFKVGRDGDKPGILFPARPAAGQVYRQEWSPGNAEDAAMVLTTTYRYGRDAALDALMPPVLAQRFCSAGDCVVTADFSPLEPDALERKYYARGVGLILETDPASEKAVQLTGCNFDSRCIGLPRP